MRVLVCSIIVLLGTASIGEAEAARPSMRSSVKVAHVDNGTVLIDGGSNVGLTPGMTLTIRRRQSQAEMFGGDAQVSLTIATLKVVSVTSTAALCEVTQEYFEIQRGDRAVLPQAERQNLVSVQRPDSQTDELPRPLLPMAATLQPRATEVATVKTSPATEGTNTPPPSDKATVPILPPVQEPPAATTPQIVAQVASSANRSPAADASAVNGNANDASRPEAQSSIDENAAAPVLSAENGTASNIKADFNVKYVAEDAVYIDGGKNVGLAQGMTLTVRRLTVSTNGPLRTTTIAEIAVVSVSNTSAVCAVKSKTSDIQRGDIARLSQEDQTKLAQMETMGPTRKYPQVIAFSEGDPLDEEVRDNVPKPPLPEINRGRGRIGLDYTFINSSASGIATTTTQIGGVVRLDISRVGGTYWNLNGYWRGRLAQRHGGVQAQSVFDLVNRTYTIGATYMNPHSGWVAGVGRMYLPWATSLDTFDGGYVGRRMGPNAVVGIFAGSTPDPTSFDYNPDRRTAGTFVAFEGGSFDKVRYTSTTGFAVSGLGWDMNRQYVFTENGVFYKRYFSLYHTMQVDSQRLPGGGKAQGLSRSFATLRVQPVARLSIDLNHTYFRDVPTPSGALIATGLLDKFLFQGVSIGSRVELPRHISVYDNFGLSNRSGDSRNSYNQLYGVTFGHIWKTGFRADMRYSKFNSSFGQGNYRAISLSRNLSESFRFEVNAGEQNFVSSLAQPTDYRLLGTLVDWNAGTHLFFESGFNVQRSKQQNYQQWLTTIGYRFDTGRPK